jgi:hypothetical protein
MVAGAANVVGDGTRRNPLTISDRQRHMPSQVKKTEQTYRLASERYAQLGVDTDRALKKLKFG